MKGTKAEHSINDTQLFRDVFNASPVGIAVESLEGEPVFVNPALCSMLGFSEEEMRGKHCVDFSPSEDAEKDWRLFQQLRAGSIDHYQLEKRYFRRDGSLVWGRLSLSLLNHRPSPLVIAMVEDITEQRKAEEARFRHAAIVESSEDAIASGTLDGIIVSWNRGAEKMYGYTEAEAIGKPITILVPPELPDEEEKILQTLKAGGRIEHFETVRVTKSGKKINVSLSVCPIKDSSGAIVGLSGIARDITERKRHQEALRASEERLRMAQQAALMGTFEWNIETGVNTWTPELEALYGLPAGGFGGTQAAFEKLVHPEDRARVKELTGASLQSGQPAKGEWRVLWPDGSVHWIAGRWQAFMDESGKPSRLVGVNVNIDERKRSRDKLREYETAVESAEDMIAVIDREYRFLLANRQYLKMRNLTREQVVGHFLPEVLNREVFETVIKPKLDECFQGKVVRYEMKFSYPEFGERDLLLSYFPIEGVNGVDRAACILRDITDRKLAEEARFRLAAIVESSEDAIISKDLDGVVTSWNAGAQRIFGYTEQETIGRPINLIPPELLDDETKRFERLKSGERIEPYETIRFTKTGKKLNVSVSLSPIKDATGAIVGFSKIARDVTERKLAEQALAQMTRKLIEAQEQERARIARDLHDDVGQRLAMVIIQLAQLQVDPSELRSRLQEVEKEVTEISNDVQTLSHELHSSKLEYLGAVAVMKSWCREFAERQGIEINCRSDISSLLPSAVGLTLLRVLQEAAHNAIKHSAVKRIEVQLLEQANEVHLVITDKGMGFDVETAMQGRGLGLVSMRERVRLVNGTIAIDSKPMAGTTIHVSVPLASEHGSERAAV